MRITRVVLPWFLKILLCVPLGAQQPPQRDPQATEILARSYDAMGGRGVAGLSDIRISGSVLMQWAQEQVPGTIRFDLVLPDKSRADIQVGSDWIAHIVNGRRAAVIRDGKQRRLPFHTMINKRPEQLPVLTEVADWNDPSWNVAYRGLESLNGQVVHHIRMQKLASGGTQHDVELSKLTAVDLFIEGASYVLVKRSRQVPSTQSYKATFLTEETYSDYRAIGSLLVPYSICSYVRGQSIMAVSVISVIVNSGIGTTEFEVR